jgi:PAS domain-containing protein
MGQHGQEFVLLLVCNLQGLDLTALGHVARDLGISAQYAAGIVISWNAGAARIKGYRPEESIGQHFSRFYPQDAIDRAWPQKELKRATASGRFEDEG